MVTRDPTWINASAGSPSYDATDLRRVDALIGMTDGNPLGAQSGIRPGGGGYTTTLSGSTINVNAGVAELYVSNVGMYRVAMTSAWSGTLTAADATYTRIDLVYLRVWDDDVDGSGLRQGDVVYLAGTPSATPVAPTPPGSAMYMPLATITVPASGGGSATVSTAVRPVTVAPGGIIPSSTQTGYYAGQYRDNGTTLQRYTGSAWEDMQKVVTTAWTQPTLAANFAHNGNSNGNVRYRKVTVEGDTWMEWEGGVAITYVSNSIQNSGNILDTALSASFRPPTLRSLTAACSSGTSSTYSLKVDFTISGQVQIIGTTTASSDTYATPIIRPPWVSLNGLRYRI